MSDASSENKSRQINKRFFKWPPKKPAPRRDFGSIFQVIASALAIFIASQFLAGLIAALALKITDPGASLTVLDENAPAQFVYIALAESLVIIFVWKLLKTRRFGLDSIGLGRRPKFSDVTNAVIGFVAFYGLLLAAGFLLVLLAPDFKTDQPQDVGFENIRTFLDQAMAFAALVVFAPVAEEILVRGYLYTGLRYKLNFIPAMVVTSFIFALAHLTGGQGLVWGAAINTFVLSLVLVFLREKTGALYAAIIIHAMNNLVAYIVQFSGALQ